MKLLYADTTAQDVLHRWSGSDVEFVVKMGVDGCMLGNGQVIPQGKLAQPIDTTGAGDAFNAGYLARRIGSGSPAEAADFANRLAACVIGVRGAIIPTAHVQELLRGLMIEDHAS